MSDPMTPDELSKRYIPPYLALSRQGEVLARAATGSELFREVERLGIDPRTIVLDRERDDKRMVVY
jgi:hypothetical protein